jgi:threonine dehydrogenase-like Zn-dependent dehydrogenase
VAGRPVGKRVGVIGAGTIGLVSYLVATDQGAADVVVADLSPERREQAARLGAKVVEQLDDEYDVIIDAVGAPATHRASVARIRPGGTAVWLGLMSDDAGFDSLDLVRQEKAVRGSFCYTDAEFAEAIALAGRVQVDWTQTFALEEGARVFTELMNGRDDIVKALLRP